LHESSRETGRARTTKRKVIREDYFYNAGQCSERWAMQRTLGNAANAGLCSERWTMQRTLDYAANAGLCSAYRVFDLAVFDLFLAIDAEGRPRQRFKPLHADRPFAMQAVSVTAFFQAFQGQPH
jgi:hypothetical protein